MGVACPSKIVGSYFLCDTACNIAVTSSGCPLINFS